MPTYTVTSPRGALTAQQKERIAHDVTRVHSEVTGANAFFAQVLFVEADDRSWFQGGVPVAATPIFIHGQVRAGRPPEVKAALLDQLAGVVASGAGLLRRQVWAYILELPPSLMVEYGRVLPEPGQEAAWLASLPPDERQIMERMGR
jgi:phenylpyruvate tautomerase PptA (4-oxalocrotonate tautomerase family)